MYVCICLFGCEYLYVFELLCHGCRACAFVNLCYVACVNVCRCMFVCVIVCVVGRLFVCWLVIVCVC